MADLVSRINDALDGRLRLTIVGPRHEDILQAVGKGTVELALVPTSQLASSGIWPMAVFDIPFLFSDLDEVAGIRDGFLGQSIFAMLPDKGAIGIAYFDIGMSRLLSLKMLNTSADLASVPLATLVSEPIRVMLTELGLQPTSLAADEYASAIEAGRIGAVELPLEPIVEEMVDLPKLTVAARPFRPDMAILAVNRSFWHQLGPREQRVIHEEATAESVILRRRLAERDKLDSAQLWERGFSFAAADSERFDPTPEAVSGRLIETAHEGRDWGGLFSILNEQRGVEQPIREKSPDGKRTDRTQQVETVLLATNRNFVSNEDPRDRFGGKNAALTFWRASLDASERLIDLVPVNEQSLPKILPTIRELTMFIHGYSNTFYDALVSGQRIRHSVGLSDDHFMVYSWPSAGRSRDSNYDEQRIWDSRAEFFKLLDTIKVAPNLDVIAHSKGAHLVIRLTDWRGDSEQPIQGRLRNLVLCAPDEERDNFATRLFPKVAPIADRWTLYASGRDRALGWARSLVHSSAPALGQGGDKLVDMADVDTIDVSNASGDHGQGFHSYCTVNDLVKQDLAELINGNAPPGLRKRPPLFPGGSVSVRTNPFWVIR